MALSPQTSADAMALTITLAYAAVFANDGIAIDPTQLAKCPPCAGTLKSFVVDAATDSTFVCLESIRHEGSRVFLTCDKGGHGNFVKVLSWYNKKEARVTTFNLDNDKVGGTSRDCALAIKHSLIAFYGEEDAKSSLWGQCTDSGGGGIGKSFSKELNNEETLSTISRTSSAIARFIAFS